MNLSGEPVDTPVTYQVVEMEKQKDGQEKEGRKVLTGTVEANKSLFLRLFMPCLPVIIV